MAGPLTLCVCSCPQLVAPAAAGKAGPLTLCVCSCPQLVDELHTTTGCAHMDIKEANIFKEAGGPMHLLDLQGMPSVDTRKRSRS